MAEAVKASKKSSSSPDDLRWCLRLLEAVELGAKRRAEADEARVSRATTSGFYIFHSFVYRGI